MLQHICSHCGRMKPICRTLIFAFDFDVSEIRHLSSPSSPSPPKLKPGQDPTPHEHHTSKPRDAGIAGPIFSAMNILHENPISTSRCVTIPRTTPRGKLSFQSCTPRATNVNTPRGSPGEGISVQSCCGNNFTSKRLLASRIFSPVDAPWRRGV